MSGEISTSIRLLPAPADRLPFLFSATRKSQLAAGHVLYTGINMQTSPQDRGLVRREGSLISTDTHHPNIMVAFTGLYIKKKRPIIPL